MKYSYFLFFLAICLSAQGQLSGNGNATAEPVSKMPDFTKYSDVKQKKKAFFDFLKPMAKQENENILVERRRVKALLTSLKEKAVISSEDEAWLKEKASELRVIDFDAKSAIDYERLLQKVDVIPESLFLAQAALESSWGTSRFARTANNIFGQWCFTEGCGIVPSQRRTGETHEVQKFETVNEAVKTYMHHLNSHPFYVKLRDSRLASRKAGTDPSGYAMAIGLEKYSARGMEYVKEIRSVISYNKLEAGLKK